MDEWHHTWEQNWQESEQRRLKMQTESLRMYHRVIL
jgi:hypothetical protein